MLVFFSRAYAVPSNCLWFSGYYFSVKTTAPLARAVADKEHLVNMSLCPCTEVDLPYTLQSLLLPRPYSLQQ